MEYLLAQWENCFFRLLEDPSFNACDAKASASNGFSIFVVRRHEKIKFAFQLAEIIYSHKGVFFISCLKAMKVCAVIIYVCTVFYKHWMSDLFSLVSLADSSFRFRMFHHIKTPLPYKAAWFGAFCCFFKARPAHTIADLYLLKNITTRWMSVPLAVYPNALKS